MPTEVTLIDGTVAVMRSPKEVPEGRRGPVVDASVNARKFAGHLEIIKEAVDAGTSLDRISIPGVEEDAVELMGCLRDLISHVIIAFVKSWSYGPVSVETLLMEVPGEVYDQLRDMTIPLYPQIVPNFTADANVIGRTEAGVPIIDPEGPTGPSVA